MSGSSTPFKPLALSLLIASGAMFVGQAQAAFLTDNAGQLVTAGDGSCVHTGDWQPPMGACPTTTLVVVQQPAVATYALHDAEFFGFNKAQLSQLARDRLRPLALAVRNADGLLNLKVTGHADPIGSDAYNRSLALRRAQAVRDYLVGAGIPADRIRLASDGDNQPIVDCPTTRPEQQRIRCLAPDRRVDVVAVLRDDMIITSVATIPPPA